MSISASSSVGAPSTESGAFTVRRKTSLATRGYRLASGTLIHAVLVVFGILFAFPFLWMVSTSIKPDAELFALPPVWIPSHLVWSNYPDALTFIPFFRYALNTLYLAAFNVTGILISCTLVAYGFARIRWPGRDALFAIMVATMLIPTYVTLIPTFLIFKWLGWVGTYNPLTLPSLTGSAFYIFLIRQFYLTIPLELSEAARIDGCGEFGIYRRIILPLSKPVLATVALFTFMGEWNSFLGPLIYLSDRATFPLGLGMYGYYSAHDGVQWAWLMAACTTMAMPVLLLFFVAQKTFIQGITLTGLKG
jgi:multiple sugar transport system permease protein